MSVVRVQGGWAGHKAQAGTLHAAARPASRDERLAELGQAYPALDASVLAMLYDELHTDEALLAARLAEMQEENDGAQRSASLATLCSRFAGVGDDVIALVFDEHGGDAERAQHDLEQLSCAGHSDDALAQLQREWDSAVEPTLIALLWEECQGDAAQVTELLHTITREDAALALPATRASTDAQVHDDDDDKAAARGEAVSFLRGVFPHIDASFLGSLVHACEGDAQAALATLLPLLDEEADADTEEPVERDDHVPPAPPSLAELGTFPRSILPHLTSPRLTSSLAQRFPNEEPAILEGMCALLELLPAHEPSHVLRALHAAKGNRDVALNVLLSQEDKANGSPPRPVPAPSRDAGRGRTRGRGRGRARVMHAPGAASLAPDAWQGRISAAEKLALREMFPGVPPTILEEVHIAARSLDATVRQMRDVYGLEARVHIPFPTPDEDDNESEAGLARVVTPLESHLPAARLAELEGKTRAELLAYAHGEAGRRNRYYALAAEALHDGDADAARKLRQQAHECDGRVHAAQTLAALHVAQGASDAAEAEHGASREVASGVYEVDLHGFLVKEALQVLDAMLHRLSQNPHARLLKVITGAGYHSGPRGPRIKPAVLAYLRARALPHYVLNAGSYLVQLPKGWVRL